MIHGGNVWSGQTPGQWLDFSANLRPEGPPDWLTDVLNHALQDIRYYPDPDLGAARSGLAAYLGVPSSCVLPTAGGAAAIDLVLSRLTGTVRTARPTFSEYAGRARVHGRPFSHDLTVVHAGDSIVVCNPNNPTGSVRTPSDLLSLHDDIARQGGELVVDEAFIDYCPSYSVRTHVDDSLIIVGSMTKLLGIPGVRLGYIIAPDALISTFQSQLVPWSLNTLATSVAAALPGHMADIRADVLLNEDRKARFSDALRALGADVMPSAANFLLVRFDREMHSAIPWLRMRSILVRDCTSFGLDDHYLRLAVKTYEQNARLTEELTKWLKQ